ncbi:MAG TPA: NAD-dependent epimerase/dehydratase family protein [Drouetiella sp.]
MKAFISGGSGFIGSFIASNLISLGHEVTIFDKNPTNLLGQSERIRFIQGDLLEINGLADAMRGHDTVFHLAANADISKGVADTKLDLNLTTIATYNILESMRLSDPKRIIFLSGSGVYGITDGAPVKETFAPLIPVSLYGANKLAAEGLISAFANMFDLQAIIFRPANVVGVGQTHGVLFDFLKKLKANPSELEILGDGNQTKSYLHVSDLYEAIMLVLNSQPERVQLFNVASDDVVDVNWIAQEVIRSLSLKSVNISRTGGAVGWRGDVSQIKLDTKKLKSVGWAPRFNSKEAVQKALNELNVAKVGI